MERGLWPLFAPTTNVRIAFVASLELLYSWPLPTCNNDVVESPIMPFSLVRVPILFPADMSDVASITQALTVQVRGRWFPPRRAQVGLEVFQEQSVLDRVHIAPALLVYKR
eukprot:1731589-Pyramimonas_sp.AAC.1